MKPLGVSMMTPLGASSADPHVSDAFLRSCQATPVSLQMAELRDHIDSRWDEMLRTCKDALRQPMPPVLEETLQKLCKVELQNHIDCRWEEMLHTCKDALRQPTVPEGTVQQLCKASAETVSEIKSLRRQTSNLEERFMRYIARQPAEQKTGSIREVTRNADNPLGETGAEMRLEARLMNMQQSQSARFDEVLQQCQRLHAFLEERMVTVPSVNAPSVSVGALSPQRHKHQVPAVFDIPESQAETPCERVQGAAEVPAWLLPAKTDPSSLSLSREVGSFKRNATQDVSGLMQTLGWSDAGIRSKTVGDEVMSDEVGVMRFRIYLQWFSTSLVAVNAIFMGIAAEAGLASAIQKEPDPEWARVGDIVFLLLFVSELLVRVAVDKWKFCYRPDIGWNIADVVTTMLMGLEVAFSIGGNASFLRAMRLLRFIRALRALRVFRSLKTARLMFSSLYNVVSPIACTLAFLLFILYLTSLGVSQIVEQYISESGGSEDLLELYGSLWATMFTFFMAIMGGAEWRQLLRPLHATSGLLVFLFVVVEVFAIFGITNLLTAIIVDGVIRSSQTNERLAMRASMVERRSAVNELRQVFNSLPPGTNGMMERRLAAKVLKSEGKHYLEGMGIELQTALGLLKMLDTEGCGCIHVDEFLCNLSQLQAENMSVHMTTTIYESKKILQSIAALKRLIEESWFQALAVGKVGSFANGAFASGASTPHNSRPG